MKEFRFRSFRANRPKGQLCIAVGLIEKKTRCYVALNAIKCRMLAAWLKEAAKELEQEIKDK